MEKKRSLQWKKLPDWIRYGVYAIISFFGIKYAYYKKGWLGVAFAIFVIYVIILRVKEIIKERE